MNITEITDKEINSNFVIRIETKELKRSFLVSAYKYRRLINDDILVNKHFLKSFNAKLRKTTIKLRRGLTVNFCSK